MPAAPPPSRDVALETRFFWERYKKPILVLLVVALVGALGFAGYRVYQDRRTASASALLAAAKNARDYEQVIARYSGTPAAADACLLLAEAQRKEGKFAEAYATLQRFIDKYPKHELQSTARMGMAANLESMGKNDEALSMYRQIAANYPNSYNAPLALLSQVYLLKAENQTEEARRVCETLLTQYRTSFWAGEALQELRLLKPSEPAKAPPMPTVPPFLARPPEPLPQSAPSPKQP